jgi:lipopolysaccharide export system protein LptA
MNTQRTITFLKILILFAIFFASNIVYAQKKSEIILEGANSLEYDVNIGPNVQRLIGDVRFRQGNTTLSCDSAYLYNDKNCIDAYGNVHIVSGGNNIYGDTLKYNGDSKIAELLVNVKMVDKQMTLTTNHLIYDLNTDVGNYNTGGKIVDKKNTLTSRKGYYFSKKKEFFFKDTVVLVNKEYTMRSDTLMYNTQTDVSYFYGPTTIVSKENNIYCENGWYDTKKDISQFNQNAVFENKEQTLKGDSLYYDRINGIGKAFKNVYIKDSAQKVVLTGEYALYFEKKGNTLITDHAMLTKIMDKDSLFLHADTLRAIFDSTKTNKTLFAYNKAKFFKTDMQGMSDSIVYIYKDSIINLYKSPVLWTGANQLTADTIKIFLGNNEIKQMNLYSSSFIISRDDTSGYTIAKDKKAIVDSLKFNQVKGKNIIGYFVKNELKRINVYGNGETIYVLKESSGASIGINKAESTDMKILLDENKIQKITFISQPVAVLYPEKDLLVKERFLKDFKWYSDYRPENKSEIFNWAPLKPAINTEKSKD